tara:strand:+ start:304 stop:594 length:291 start_codon:yes stop_codon:yes gene_type:complete
VLIRKTKGNTSNKTDGAFNIVTYRGKNKLEFVFLKKLISSNKFNIIIKDKKKMLIFKKLEKNFNIRFFWYTGIILFYSPQMIIFFLKKNKELKKRY